MTELSQDQIQPIVDRIFSLYSVEDIEKAMQGGAEDYSRYADDPVGFISEVMGITLTPDIIKLAVSVRDNRVTLAKSATGTGKTHGAAAIGCWFYKCKGNASVYTVANPFQNQKLLWNEIVTTANSTDIFSDDDIKTMHIEPAKPGKGVKKFITALSVPTTGTEEVKESKFSGNHNEAQLFEADEGDTTPDFAYRGVEGCMSGDFERLLVLFNPRHKLGAPYRMEKSGEANVIQLSAFGHPNVITGKVVIPGAVSRKQTVERINKWCRPIAEDEMPSSNTFELPEFLVGAVSGSFPPLKAGHYFINEPCFHYMVLGQYPPQSEYQLISEEWVNKARARWDLYVAEYGEKPPEGVRPVQGGDVGEFGTDKSVSFLRYGGWVARPDWWHGQDPDYSSIRFADIHKTANAARSCVDGTGVGSAVAPAMVRLGCTAITIKSKAKPTKKSELGEFEMLRDQLLWEYREWLKLDQGAMLPPSKNLIEETLALQYHYHVKNGNICVTSSDALRAALKRSPDELASLILTFAPEAKEGGRYDFD